MESNTNNSSTSIHSETVQEYNILTHTMYLKVFSIHSRTIKNQKIVRKARDGIHVQTLTFVAVIMEKILIPMLSGFISYVCETSRKAALTPILAVAFMQ